MVRALLEAPVAPIPTNIAGERTSTFTDSINPNAERTGTRPKAAQDRAEARTSNTHSTQNTDKKSFSDETKAFCDRILDARSNDNAVLGIRDGASMADLRKAYRKAAFGLHADKFETLTEEQRVKLSDAFTAATKAYDRLKKVTPDASPEASSEARTEPRQHTDRQRHENHSAPPPRNDSTGSTADFGSRRKQEGRTHQAPPRFSTESGARSSYTSSDPLFGGAEHRNPFSSPFNYTEAPGYAQFASRMAPGAAFERARSNPGPGLAEMFAQYEKLYERRMRWAEAREFKAVSAIDVITDFEGLQDLTRAVDAMKSLRESHWSAVQVGRILEALLARDHSNTFTKALCIAFEGVYGGRDIRAHLHDPNVIVLAA